MLYNETLNAIPLNTLPLNEILLNNHQKMCSSSTIYIVLFAIFFITSKCISSAFIYFHWYLKIYNIPVRFYPNTQTTLY